jgi:predicted transcriptional regulator
MTVKESVLATLAEMPDSATLSEIIEQLCLQMAIEEGLQDVAAGRYYTQEEVMAHFQHGAPLPDLSQGRSEARSSVKV